MNVYKLLLIFLGTLSLGIGILGIIVPGLPTTVFLLITAGLYARSSERLYNKLLSHRHLGPYIRNFRDQKGMTLALKIKSIGIMWIMISISSLFLIESKPVIIVVLALGVVGTVVMGFIVNTVKHDSHCTRSQENGSEGKYPRRLMDRDQHE